MMQGKPMKYALYNLIAIVFSYLPAFSQDSLSIQNKMEGHWVTFSGYREDIVVYVPYKSPRAEELSLELKYGGVSFCKNNVFRTHRWKMCGNDDSPDYYDGAWYVKETDKKWVLTTVDIDKQVKKYIIESIKEEEIVLTPIDQ
jgi:hypothetical protein